MGEMDFSDADSVSSECYFVFTSNCPNCPSCPRLRGNSGLVCILPFELIGAKPNCLLQLNCPQLLGFSSFCLLAWTGRRLLVILSCMPLYCPIVLLVRYSCSFLLIATPNMKMWRLPVFHLYCLVFLVQATFVWCVVCYGPSPTAYWSR